MRPNIQGLVLVLLLLSGTLHADDNKTLSKSVFNRLAKVEKLMAEQDFAAAQKKLDGLIEDPPSRATDKAYVFHSQGTLYLYQEKYKQAQRFYAKSYNLQAMSEKTTAALAQTLASLAMHFADYRQAIDYLKVCLRFTEEPPPKQVYLGLGTAYYQLKEYAEAVSPLETAMAKFKPDKSVHLMLFASYYELGRKLKAAAVMEKVIRAWPEEGRYWLQLASLYLELKKTDKSLEILQLAFTRKLLLKQSELLQYVYTLYEKGLPYKASVVLSKGLENGSVEKNYKNLSLLATLYVEAREDDSALETFKTITDYSSDGKEDLYIAQLFYDKERFKDAIEHARAALNKGVKNPGSAYMLMASSHLEIGQEKQAKSNLEKATKYKATKKAALRWLSHM
jgi:tetratricopeptide (TPR) repeat protein